MTTAPTLCLGREQDPTTPSAGTVPSLWQCLQMQPKETHREHAQKDPGVTTWETLAGLEPGEHKVPRPGQSKVPSAQAGPPLGPQEAPLRHRRARGRGRRPRRADGAGKAPAPPPPTAPPLPLRPRALSVGRSAQPRITSAAEGAAHNTGGGRPLAVFRGGTDVLAPQGRVCAERRPASQCPGGFQVSDSLAGPAWGRAVPVPRPRCRGSGSVGARGPAPRASALHTSFRPELRHAPPRRSAGTAAGRCSPACPPRAARSSSRTWSCPTGWAAAERSGWASVAAPCAPAPPHGGHQRDLTATQPSPPPSARPREHLRRRDRAPCARRTAGRNGSSCFPWLSDPLLPFTTRVLQSLPFPSRPADGAENTPRPRPRSGHGGGREAQGVARTASGGPGTPVTLVCLSLGAGRGVQGASSEPQGNETDFQPRADRRDVQSPSDRAQPLRPLAPPAPRRPRPAPSAAPLRSAPSSAPHGAGAPFPPSAYSGLPGHLRGRGEGAQGTPSGQLARKYFFPI